MTREYALEDLDLLDAARFEQLRRFASVELLVAGTFRTFDAIWRNGVLSGLARPHIGGPQVAVAIAAATALPVDQQIADLFAHHAAVGSGNASCGLIGLADGVAGRIDWYSPAGLLLGWVEPLEVIRPLLRALPFQHAQVTIGFGLLKQITCGAVPLPGMTATLAGPLFVRTSVFCDADEILVEERIGSGEVRESARTFWVPGLSVEQLSLYQTLRAADLPADRALASVQLLGV